MARLVIYLVRTETCQPLHLDIGHDQGMYIWTYPNPVAILLCVDYIVKERCLRQGFHRKPATIRRKSARSGVFRILDDQRSGFAVNSICRDNGIRGDSFVSSIDTSFILVLEELGYADPESNLYANGHSIIIHDLVCPTTARVQDWKAIEVERQRLLVEKSAL